jgi:hypothetical protein
MLAAAAVVVRVALADLVRVGREPVVQVRAQAQVPVQRREPVLPDPVPWPVVLAARPVPQVLVRVPQGPQVLDPVVPDQGVPVQQVAGPVVPVQRLPSRQWL